MLVCDRGGGPKTRQVIIKNESIFRHTILLRRGKEKHEFSRFLII